MWGPPRKATPTMTIHPTPSTPAFVAVSWTPNRGRSVLHPAAFAAASALLNDRPELRGVSDLADTLVKSVKASA